MSVTAIHPEDVKAQLRKKHGTIGNFARAKGLKPQAVADWLRGRTSAPVADAIANELEVEGHEIGGLSIKLDFSGADNTAHRLNAGGR